MQLLQNVIRNIHRCCAHCNTTTDKGSSTTESSSEGPSDDASDETFSFESVEELLRSHQQMDGLGDSEDIDMVSSKAGINYIWVFFHTMVVLVDKIIYEIRANYSF